MRVEDILLLGKRHTGAELDTERLAGTQNRVAYCNTGGLLVDLDGCFVCLDPDDL
jgi:hypothetical protein